MVSEHMPSLSFVQGHLAPLADVGILLFQGLSRLALSCSPLIPFHSFQPSLFSKTDRRFPTVLGGSPERRIPEKNGEVTPRLVAVRHFVSTLNALPHVP